MHWRCPSRVVTVAVTNPVHRCTGHMTLKRRAHLNADPQIVLACRLDKAPHRRGRSSASGTRANAIYREEAVRCVFAAALRIRRHSQTPLWETRRLRSFAGPAGCAPLRMRSSRQLEGNGLAVTLGRITRPQPRDLGVNERAWQGRGGPCLSTAQHAKRSAASDASSISLSAGASPRPGLVEGPVRLRARPLPSARRRTTARNQVELASPDIAVNRTDVLFLENSRP